jgi:hypothetical protein
LPFAGNQFQKLFDVLHEALKVVGCRFIVVLPSAEREAKTLALAMEQDDNLAMAKQLVGDLMRIRHNTNGDKAEGIEAVA